MPLWVLYHSDGEIFLYKCTMFFSIVKKWSLLVLFSLDWTCITWVCFQRIIMAANVKSSNLSRPKRYRWNFIPIVLLCYQLTDSETFNLNPVRYQVVLLARHQADVIYLSLEFMLWEIFLRWLILAYTDLLLGDNRCLKVKLTLWIALSIRGEIRNFMFPLRELNLILTCLFPGL